MYFFFLNRNKDMSKQNDKLKKRTIKKRVFSKNDYISGDGMLTPVWGPSLWHFLHTMSFNYPVNPTEEDKKNYLNFILGLQFILPCRYCRENLTKNFEVLPITNETMKSRDSFSRYIYNLHETVNKMLGKKSGLTFCDVRERYEHFRARCTDKTIKQFDIEKIKQIKNKTLKKGKEKEKGCTNPLYGKKSKCLIRIVPIEDKTETMKIDKKCYTYKKKI